MMTVGKALKSLCPISPAWKPLIDSRLPWSFIDPEKALPWIEQKTGLAVAKSQTAVFRLALLAKVLLIIDGPGVGKTTIVDSILRIVAANGSDYSCAPRQAGLRNG